MNARRSWLLGLVALLLVGGSAAANQPDPTGRDAAELAKKIDRLLAKGWADAEVTPAPLADDAEFLRRVYLDVAGRVPSVNEARSFLKDNRPDRRSRLVEQLLAGPRYVAHFTNVYRALLIPEASNNFLVRVQQGSFESWLKKQVAANAGFDQLTRDLLTAPMGAQGIGALVNLGGGTASPLAFYSAKEFKPESLAAGTARIFLGISVECAQCHNHPFTDWKREQFWSFAAFFSGIQSTRVQDFLLPGKEIPDRKELTIPGTATVVQAKYLNGAAPDWQPKAVSRSTLADWVTSPENPYFARSAVNRTWAYFFGTGLVEPVDDMVGPANNAKYATLLDLIAREFVAHKFDNKFLIRALTATDAYQRTSAGAVAADPKAEAAHDPALFARMPLRGLTAEQLFDSLFMATGFRDAGGNGDDLLSAIVGGNKSARAGFLTKFANQTQRAKESQTSILQALSLMNGKVVADATSLEKSETLAAIADAPFLTMADRIDTLYLATLSRRPRAKESERATRFIQDSVRRADSLANRATAFNSALADVFWALLNSSEFTLNH
jgi:hypothetical protein